MNESTNSMSTAQPRRLFVSLFDQLCLQNFPPGRFERRRMAPCDAVLRIEEARRNKQLHGVTAADFAIDRRAKQSAEELLQALSTVHSLELGLDDFLAPSVDCYTPLDVVAIGAGADLLVISCVYTARGTLDSSPGIISFDIFTGAHEDMVADAGTAHR